MNAPLISIMMNCYNGERYLQQAIESIIAQTYINWEIIFWDNQSTDSSASIAKSFSDNRIHYYLAPEHTNLGRAKNLAFKKVSAEWVAFLDVDDFWEKDKLEKQVRIINEDNGEVGLIYGRANILYENQDSKIEVYKKGQPLPEGDIFNQLLYENFIPFVTTIVNKNKFVEIGAFSDKLSHSTDYHMFLHLAFKYKVRVIQEICGTVRLHDTNLTKKMRVQAAHEAIEMVSFFLPDQIVKEALVYHQTSLVIAYLREKQLIMFFKTITEKRVLLNIISRVVKILKQRIFFYRR